jgi:hypothetical protein
MTATDQITYSVLTFDSGKWQNQGESSDMQSALAAAEKLFASNRFPKVKVDKRFFDPEHGREVTATIMERKVNDGSTGSFSILFWLAIAAIGGIVSFIATYALTSGALG